MAEVSVTDLTSGLVDGPGVFDKLVQAFSAHLDQEYVKGRIKGTEYSQVYLGGMQHAMDTALKLLLQQQRVDLEAQLLTVQVENAGKEGVILDDQHTKIGQEIAAEKPALEALVLTATECKLKGEFDVLEQQVLKIIAETAVLTQKKVTESAQTNSVGVDVDSVVGRQKALYQAQSDGYLRDAEQKTAKILVDTWNVRRTTDGGTIADSTNRLDDSTIGQAINQLLTGINVS